MIADSLKEFEKEAAMGMLIGGLTAYTAYDDLKTGKKKARAALSGQRGFRPLMQRGMYQLQGGRFSGLRRL